MAFFFFFLEILCAFGFQFYAFEACNYARAAAHYVMYFFPSLSFHVLSSSFLALLVLKRAGEDNCTLELLKHVTFPILF